MTDQIQVCQVEVCVHLAGIDTVTATYVRMKLKAAEEVSRAGVYITQRL